MSKYDELLRELDRRVTVDPEAEHAAAVIRELEADVDRLKQEKLGIEDTSLGEIGALNKDLAAARGRIAELDHLFDLQERRSREAADLWRAANPSDEYTIPDLGALLAWMMGLIAELEGECEKLRSWRSSVTCATSFGGGRHYDDVPDLVRRWRDHMTCIGCGREEGVTCETYCMNCMQAAEVTP